MASIAVVDDDKGIREALQELLVGHDHYVQLFGNAEDAIRYIRTEEPDLVLLDMQLPGMDGLECLRRIKAHNDEIVVVIITGHADISTAVTAMKLGAWDYIRKPFNLDEIILTIRKAVEKKHKDEQIAYLQKEKDHRLGFNEIIGQSSQIKEVFRFIRQVADSARTTVLIRGETGTGKELVARAIHYNSQRAQKPFIEINCSAFQETLLEAELFGYEQGAFTGASHRKKGLLEVAHQGTFFLDEIGDMDIGLQAKLLRVLEEQKFRRVGGTREINVDCRIISATSRDIDKLVREEKFREDLFYRLNVASVAIPPLRQREGDVLVLAQHFLKLFNAEFKKNVKGISKPVEKMLLWHSWPGNVRELKNVIERAVLFEKSKLLTAESVNLFGRDVQPRPMSWAALDECVIPPDGVSLTEVERSLIENALSTANGNQTRAAKLLKISRETLKYRMKKFAIATAHRKSK